MTEPVTLMSLVVQVRDQCGRTTSETDRRRIAARIAHLSVPEQNAERAALRRLLYLGTTLPPKA